MLPRINRNKVKIVEKEKIGTVILAVPIFVCTFAQLLLTNKKIQIRMKKSFLLIMMLLLSVVGFAGEVVWFDGSHPVSYSVPKKVEPVVTMALRMFSDDMRQVTGMAAKADKHGKIRIIPHKGGDDGFRIYVKEGCVVVEGNSGRGTAYGILELSRMAGVSPWIWWGDVVPEHRSQLSMPASFSTEQHPSVTYRGIFINDEDWSLRNWAWKTFEKTDQFGAIGPKTYKEIFKLLLRLRANAIWPGMHTGTPGFFTIKGNKEMADSFGILIGTSHCEPLLRNNVAEWDHAKRGAYNYITNRDEVKRYWTERLQQVAGSEELFTIGMRGIHDGSMEGVKTKEEKLQGLQQVIDDQRELLRKYINKDVTKVPQVFIPYKEVLEIMESGLKVPDDVTLMWCDDNYGYMTRLSDAEQQKRSGGGGVYYHLSYWGRPHDYLWLTTTQPGLTYSEMKAAYDHNARKLWIVNVHDPKVAAYDLEFFLDMAWDINSIQPQTINQHLERWLTTQFGEEAGRQLAPAMKEFYRLTAIRKPEFMGWTQVELDRKIYPRGRSQVIDTEFSQTEFANELERYLADYAAICQMVDRVEQTIRPELRDAFFAAIKYPVRASAAMAVKMLEAQKARSRYLGQTDKAMEGREKQMLESASRSMAAYREIQRLTDYYNNEMTGGKWKGAMNMMPRDLYVFFPPTLPYMPSSEKESFKLPYQSKPYAASDFVSCNGSDYNKATKGVQAIQMLGHSMNAVSIPKGGSLTYDFDVQREGEATLYTAMIPTQPNDKGDLRYSITIDDGQPVVISLKEKFRSEFWKKSVLRGQALKTTPVSLKKGHHTLTIRALDEHIIIDQWMVDFKKDRRFYMIPVANKQLTQSGLDAERFDSVIDGKKTGLYTIVNQQGMEACVTNYGARLVSLVYEGRDRVIGFDNVGDYRRFRQNYGATVGRYVGRIKGSRFVLDGQEHHLQENGKGVTAHGGYPGFADRIWTMVAKTDSTVTLQYVSADGENGFPGELTVNLTYKVSNKNGLEVSYEATTTKPTVVNLTNHSFFNVGGRMNQEITNETLWVNSDKIATFDAQKNVDGQMMNVKGTPFDFTTPQLIGARIDDNHAQLKVTKGYDHSFVLNTKGSDQQAAAIVSDMESKTRMTVYTTEPVVHIYTGNGLKGNTKGKQGIWYPRRSAVCLETMHLADSPNQPHFPSTVLRPGETFRSHTAFVFSTIE